VDDENLVQKYSHSTDIMIFVLGYFNLVHP